MMSLWIVTTVLVATFAILESFAKPEGYGDYEHQHGHGGYNTVPVVKKVVDYYSKPQYAFGYEVDDYYQQLSHGRWEIRDGDVTQGQYRVLLPDGRIQIVSYIADKGGYRPTVQYIGKGVHPPPPPVYAHIKPPKHLHVEPEVIPYNDIHEYEHGHGHGHGGHIPISGPGGPTPPFVPVLAAAKPIVPIVPILQRGPHKFDVNPHALGQIGPTGHGHGIGYTSYGQGYGYNNGDPYGVDTLAYGPSNQKIVKVSPARIAKKRALLYDRTLFRRDLKKPLTLPRK